MISRLKNIILALIIASFSVYTADTKAADFTLRNANQNAFKAASPAFTPSLRSVSAKKLDHYLISIVLAILFGSTIATSATLIFQKDRKTCLRNGLIAAGVVLVISFIPEPEAPPEKPPEEPEPWLSRFMKNAIICIPSAAVILPFLL